MNTESKPPQRYLEWLECFEYIARLRHCRCGSSHAYHGYHYRRPDDDADKYRTDVAFRNNQVLCVAQRRMAAYSVVCGIYGLVNLFIITDNRGT